MMEALGVAPGAVTPFAVVNDTERRVQVVLDRAMLDVNPLNYHPLDNDRTTAIAPADLLQFLEAADHAPELLDF
jgi:Ala-tRNA(Pro) deacylase